MTVQELIRALQRFDEQHHVVITIPDGDYPNTERGITEVKFENQNCVIKTDY